MIWRLILTILSATAVLIVSGKLGLTKELGAHPFWADKVVISGIIGGIMVWLLLAFSKLSMSKRLGLGLVALVISFAVARYGAHGFAISYAEDQFAGKLWFFGWHATMISFFVFCGAIFGKVLGLTRR